MQFVRKDGNVYGIRISRDKEEEVFLFNDVVIEELIENIDNDSISATLVYDFAGNTRRVSVSRNTYQTKRKILELQNKGLNVIEETAKFMISYLNEQESTVEIKKFIPY